MPLATVLEDDGTLREMIVGAQVAMTEYELPEDNPLREYSGFTIPMPLYYSRTMDVFFTLVPSP